MADSSSSFRGLDAPSRDFSSRMMSTAWLAYTYIGLFSLGCATTMSGYGYVVGRFYRRANHTGQRIYRALVILTSMSGLVLGTVWILKNL